MTEYAPAAIRAVFDQLVAAAPRMSLELAGILGDKAHTYGYHRARAVLPRTDYSVELPVDQAGDEWAASALDIKPAHPGGMVALTRRLAVAARRRDPRITSVVREFFGTTDGVTVYGEDLYYRQSSKADRSHLWHLHISFYRQFANRSDVLAPVAEVLATPLVDVARYFGGP